MTTTSDENTRRHLLVACVALLLLTVGGFSAGIADIHLIRLTGVMAAISVLKYPEVIPALVALCVIYLCFRLIFLSHNADSSVHQGPRVELNLAMFATILALAAFASERAGLLNDGAWESSVANQEEKSESTQAEQSESTQEEQSDSMQDTVEVERQRSRFVSFVACIAGVFIVGLLAYMVVPLLLSVAAKLPWSVSVVYPNAFAAIWVCSVLVVSAVWMGPWLFSKFLEENQLRRVARNTRLSADPRVRYDVATQLSADPNEAVRAGLATNPNEAVRAVLATNPNTASEMLELLADDSEANIRERVVRNPSAPSNALSRLVADTEDGPPLPPWSEHLLPQTLRELANDPSPAVRLRVAEHPNTPINVLKSLLCDSVNKVLNGAKANLKAQNQDVSPKCE